MYKNKKARYVNVHFEWRILALWQQKSQCVSIDFIWWRWGDSPYSDCWRKSNRVQPQGFRHAVHVQLQLCCERIALPT